jgi:DNA-directed RNA polymerase subunit RPC12/RpoP
MPVLVKCDQCGFILAEYNELPTANSHKITWISSLRNRHNKKCPSCGHKLAQKPLTISVRAFDGRAKCMSDLKHEGPT